jgi:hypothetical protein
MLFFDFLLGGFKTCVDESSSQRCVPGGCGGDRRGLLRAGVVKPRRLKLRKPHKVHGSNIKIVVAYNGILLATMDIGEIHQGEL